jgi:hypothetical protein
MAKSMEMTTLGCRMREDEHRDVRLLSVHRKESMQDLYAEAFEDFLELHSAGTLEYLTQPPTEETKCVSLTVPARLATQLQDRAIRDSQNKTDTYYTAVRLFLEKARERGDIPTFASLGMSTEMAS